MFLANWFYSALDYLDLRQKYANLVFLGLDNAGKSALLHMLKFDWIVGLEPTFHPLSGELVLGNIRFSTIDLGGHEIARRTWKNYLDKADAIIFVVDSADRERFSLAKHELSELLESEGLYHTPFAIFGNKIDLPEAASEGELTAALGLETCAMLLEGRNLDRGRAIRVFMCSVTKRYGYTDGLKWISQFIT